MTTPLTTSEQDSSTRAPSDTWSWRAALRAGRCDQDADTRMPLDVWALQHLVAYATVDATAYELGQAMGVADCQVEAAMRRLADKGLVTGRPSLFGHAWEPTPKGLALFDCAPDGVVADPAEAAA